MASIQQDPSGNYHVSFRFGGKRFKRSLKTKIHRKAEAAASHIEENIRLLEAGRMTLPEDADIPTFLMSDGRLRNKVKTQESIRLDNLLDRFKEDSPEGAFELTTLKTTAIHLRHVCRILGPSKSFGALKTTDLQAYVSTRSREPGQRGSNVSAATIRKEIATLGSLWNWAESRGLVSGVFPRKGLLFPKHDEKPPFQTWDQIERRIQRDGLTEEQAQPLWDCLYLNQNQLSQLLSYVQKNADYDFLFPMCCLAAFTGARRSELSRTRTADIDMVQRTYTIRERKRSRSARTTRSVPICQRLYDVLENWIDRKPASPYLFPEDHRCARVRKCGGPDAGAVSPDEATHHLSTVLGASKWAVIRGWHIFRHSFISNCASQGVDQRFIDEFVGHSTDEQRRRYCHLFPESQQQVINSVFG